jgi:4-hydroxy-3-polyprenylbenzoate decarboxylase
MNFAKPYNDLREFIGELEKHDKLYRIQREINKDSELQPLVRWQYRGGIAESQRRGFLFDNVIDGKSHKYNCSVLVGGLSGSEAIYSLGLKCQPEEVPDRWIHALDNLVPPIMVDSGPAQEEVHMGAELLAHGGINEFAVPISTPGFDNGPYITAGHWITKDPETGQRNVGNYRGLIKGPDRTGLMTGTPQDLSNQWEKCRRMGKPLEVAIVVGTIPVVSYAATQKFHPMLTNSPWRVASKALRSN